MKNLFSVEGKTILVTGASRGLGKSMALGLKEQGAIVYGTGSKPESVEWMEKEGIIPCVADMRVLGSVGEHIQKIRDTKGRLDVLINNAGVASNTPASHFKEEEMNSIIGTNFTGLFSACQAYYKVHKKEGGNIINVASVVALVGTPLASIYSGTKGAVVAMTRALAIEWINNNYRVNAVCPGFFDTDMTSMIKDKPHVMEQLAGIIPMKRMGKPEEILGIIQYLSSSASTYVTGQTFVVDGGLVAV